MAIYINLPQLKFRIIIVPLKNVHFGGARIIFRHPNGCKRQLQLEMHQGEMQKLQLVSLVGRGCGLFHLKQVSSRH